MSTQSIISLPPQLAMTPRSISLLEKNRSKSVPANEASQKLNVETENLVSNQRLPIGASLVTTVNSSTPVRTLHKLAETTFPIKENEPLNLRICLQPTELMKMANWKQVGLGWEC